MPELDFPPDFEERLDPEPEEEDRAEELDRPEEDEDRPEALDPFEEEDLDSEGGS